MKILHLADLHLKLSGPRADECRRILDLIPERAAEVHPDAIIIAGDVFDRRSTPEERLYLAGFLIELFEKTKSPVFAINGNHDDSDDLLLFHTWRPSIVEILPRPGIRTFRDLTLAFLPWPSLGQFAVAGSGISIADRREAAKAALVDVLRGFKFEPGAPSLLVTHLPVLGASMDSGQPVSGGEQIALSADDLLSCGVAGVAVGHIHLRQAMRSGDGRPVWYAGAPFRCNFGEASGEKGGLLWTWTGKAWKVAPWDLPARRMVLLEAKWAEGKLHSLEPQSFQDAEVRLVVEFPSDEREAVRTAAWELKTQIEEKGAYSVVIEERPIVVSRTRCSEITAARTTLEKLATWSRTAGQDVPEGAAAKLAVLEKEIQI